MPIGEMLAEATAQFVMEAGGKAIKKSFGWQGCVVAVTLIVGGIALTIWLLS